jgi:DNA polymerase-3 subunit gamma/tau
LDQLIAFKGNDLTENDVLAVFGLISRSALEALAGSILQGDIPAILKAVDAFESSGKDMRRFTAELLWHFRNLLVFQQAGAELAKQDVTAEQLAVLEQQAQSVTPQRIVEITGLLSEMESRLRSALSVRTLVEMTLIRCARAAKTVSLDEVLKRLTALKDVVIRRLAAAAPQGLAAAPAVQTRTAQPTPAAQPVPVSPTPLTPPPTLVLTDDEALEPLDEDDDYAPCAEPFQGAPVAVTEQPPTRIEQLTNSNGQYIDEIVNHALQLFGGRIIV